MRHFLPSKNHDPTLTAALADTPDNPIIGSKLVYLGCRSTRPCLVFGHFGDAKSDDLGQIQAKREDVGEADDAGAPLPEPVKHSLDKDGSYT